MADGNPSFRRYSDSEATRKYGKRINVYLRTFSSYSVAIRVVNYPSEWVMQVFHNLPGQGTSEGFQNIMRGEIAPNWAKSFSGYGEARNYWYDNRTEIEAQIAEKEEEKDSSIEEVSEPVEPVDNRPGRFDSSLVEAIESVSKRVEELEKQPKPIRIRIDRPKKDPVTHTLTTHKHFEQILKLVTNYDSIGLWPMLVGPAGSGKTSLASQIAKVLELPFYAMSAIRQEHKIFGYVDAKGEYVNTLFYDAWTEGGVILLDEWDASSPNVTTDINMALANNLCPFPDGMEKRHKDCIVIAAANTVGKGADRIYTGRNALDGASLDRFACFEMDYDESVEESMLYDDSPESKDWYTTILRLRSNMLRNKVRHVISPRATKAGSAAIALGVMTKEEALESFVWKGLSEDDRRKCEGSL